MRPGGIVERAPGFIDHLAVVEALEGGFGKVPVGPLKAKPWSIMRATKPGRDARARSSERWTRARWKMLWRPSALATHLSKTRMARKSSRLATWGSRASGR